MMNYKIVFFVLALTSQAIGTFAQEVMSDSAFTLNGVTIESDRLSSLNAGYKFQEADSLSMQMHQNDELATLLKNHSSVFIKSYGLGSIATSSFRGGSASQTSLLWNGFVLNSITNGIADLSLSPVCFADEIQIQHGGSCTLWGSGALGGAIHLNNKAKYDQGWNLSTGASFGSFASNRQHIKLSYSNKRWSHNLRIFNKTALNNFKYSNPYSLENRTLNNAEVIQRGLMTSNYFRPNSNHEFSLHYWYQYNDRQVPPTLTQVISRAKQYDEFSRVSTAWKWRHGRAYTNFRLAYFNEQLAYIDDPVQSNFHTHVFISEAEFGGPIGKAGMVNLGINNTYSKAKNENYNSDPMQNRFALFGSYKLRSNSNKLVSIISFRQEVLQSKLVPFTFALGAEYKFLKWLSFKTNVARVYRNPTFNDLYWNPGGNPNLKPEDGYSEEAGVILKKKGQHTGIKLESTLFSRQVKNWIIWLPTQGYWQPQNILEVWSRGIETTTQLHYNFKKWKSELDLNSNYVVTTNLKASSENDGSVNKQLIYVPMYSGRARFSLSYNDATLGYTYNYTGYRYTTSDNSEYLEPFSLSTLYCSYTHKLKQIHIDLFFRVNNLTNTSYQAILNRPMPLRNYQTGITINFINKKNDRHKH